MTKGNLFTALRAAFPADLDQVLLRVVGASAALIASLDSKRLPVGAVEAADVVATSINCLSEETLQDALASVHAEIEDDAAAA